DAEGGTAVACDKALVVASSDYTSTNVSLLSPAGSILSEILISSGSTTTGLSTALSGDVILPLAAPPSGRVVLLPPSASVLTWVDPTTAAVTAQLSVRTGFLSNPYDYLEVAPDKAYVTRFESNPQPGKEAFDGGGDVLVIDPQSFALRGRVDLSSSDDGGF